jgi:hypothetical protein
MPDRIKFRRLFQGKGTRWFAKDDFTDTLAAGFVNGTFATDRKNTRVVVDSNGKESTSNGLLNFATGGTSTIGDPGFWLGTVQNRVGTSVIADITPASATPDNCAVGFDTNQVGAISDPIRFQGSGLMQIVQGGAALSVAVYTATNYKIIIQKRASGNFYYIKGGLFVNWTLLYPGATGSTALFPGITNRSTTSVFTSSFLYSGVTPLPSPFVSESFNRSNGALGNTDGMGTIESGGGGVPWTSGGGSISGNALIITPTLEAEQATGNLVVGTWYSVTACQANYFFTGNVVGNTFRALATTALDSNNKVKAITLSTAISTLSVPTTNHWIDIEISALTSGTQAGLITRLDSATTPANFIIVNYDGQGAIKVVEYVSNSPNQLLTLTKAFAVSDHLHISLDGAGVRCYHATTAGVPTLIGIATTAVTSGVLCGGFSTDATNKINNFVVWPKGNSSTEYAILDNYIV